MTIRALDVSLRAKFQHRIPFYAPSAILALVQNSIDAGSTQIRVRILGSHLDIIEVSDNGPGIANQDLNEIAKLYSTSKIRSLKDLRGLKTFGFKGQDLASLLDQARWIEIITSSGDSPVPQRLKLEGTSRTVRSSDSGRPLGTTVIIDTLFCNRNIINQSKPGPTKTIKDIITRLTKVAMARPDIQLRLLHNKQEIWNNGHIPHMAKSTFVHRYEGRYLFEAFLPKSGWKGMTHPVIVVDGRPLDNSKVTGKMLKESHQKEIRSKSTSVQKYSSFFFLNIKCTETRYDLSTDLEKEDLHFDDPNEVNSVWKTCLRDAFQGDNHRQVEAPHRLVTADSEYHPANESSKDVALAPVRGGLRGTAPSPETVQDSSIGKGAGISKAASVSRESNRESYSEAHSDVEEGGQGHFTATLRESHRHPGSQRHASAGPKSKRPSCSNDGPKSRKRAKPTSRPDSSIRPKKRLKLAQSNTQNLAGERLRRPIQNETPSKSRSTGNRTTDQQANAPIDEEREEGALQLSRQGRDFREVREGCRKTDAICSAFAERPRLREGNLSIFAQRTVEIEWCPNDLKAEIELITVSQLQATKQNQDTVRERWRTKAPRVASTSERPVSKLADSRGSPRTIESRPQLCPSTSHELPIHPAVGSVCIDLRRKNCTGFDLSIGAADWSPGLGRPTEKNTGL